MEASVCVKTTIFLDSVYLSCGEFTMISVCDSFYLVMYNLNYAVSNFTASSCPVDDAQ